MKMPAWLASSIGVGITMLLVGSLFHVQSPMIAPGLEVQYRNRDVFRDWNGWTSTYMLMHPFFYAPLFTAVFLHLHRTSALQLGIGYGLIYGASVFCVGSLPVFLLMFASLQVPSEAMAMWMVQNLCQYLTAGIALCIVTDGVVLRVSRQLPASADHVWDLLLRRDTFLFVISGWLNIADKNSWPEKFFVPGAIYKMKIRLFGQGPRFTHKVCVTRIDANARVIDTEEIGGLVTVWHHRMQVESLSCDRSRYTDSIELKAGLLTPVVWLFACGFYLARQRRWMKLLNEEFEVGQKEIDGHQ